MPEQTTPKRPLEVEHALAVERLNEAIYAMRVVKEAFDSRRAELHAIAKRYYEANRDLPVPEGEHTSSSNSGCASGQ